jgi:hypothetical protein
MRLRLLASVLAASSSACLPTFPATAAGGVAHADDFSDADLGNRYHLQGGSWRVVDGALSTLGDRNLPLWLRSPLSCNVRVEFTSTSASPAVDMKVEIFGDGIRHESGYIVVVGGWNNTLSGIARLDEHEAKRVMKRTRHDANRPVRWRIERTDGRTLRVFVDGEEIAAYVDDAPLCGPRNDRFAFSGWESEVRFDDLRITPLP